MKVIKELFNNQNEEVVVHIVVSHGYFTGSVAGDFDTSKCAGYCAITAVGFYSDSEPHLLIN